MSRDAHSIERRFILSLALTGLIFAVGVIGGLCFAGASTVQGRIRTLLAERFGIQHTTVQLECAHCGQGLVSCNER